jgi:hypothetical protein
MRLERRDSIPGSRGGLRLVTRPYGGCRRRSPTAVPRQDGGAGPLQADDQQQAWGACGLAVK